MVDDLPPIPAFMERRPWRLAELAAASALTADDRALFTDLPFLPPADAPAEPAPNQETAAVTNFAAGQLKSFIERIERLEEEKQTIQDDIKDVFAEAKGNGFDTKIMRRAIRLRRMDKSEREEAEAMLELYMSALGEQIGLPFEEA